MNRYLSMLPLALGLAIGIPALARAEEFWISPYSEARGFTVTRNAWIPQTGSFLNQVVLHSVIPWSAPTRGVEYETWFIAGTTATKTIRDVVVVAHFDVASPCPTAGACTIYLCRPNVLCAELDWAGVQGSGVIVNAFAGQKWRGGDELWFSLAYQVHGSGQMIPVPQSKDERVVVRFTDG